MELAESLALIVRYSPALRPPKSNSKKKSTAAEARFGDAFKRVERALNTIAKPWFQAADARREAVYGILVDLVEQPPDRLTCLGDDLSTTLSSDRHALAFLESSFRAAFLANQRHIFAAPAALAGRLSSRSRLTDDLSATVPGFNSDRDPATPASGRRRRRKRRAGRAFSTAILEDLIALADEVAETMRSDGAANMRRDIRSLLALHLNRTNMSALVQQERQSQEEDKRRVENRLNKRFDRLRDRLQQHIKRLHQSGRISDEEHWFLDRSIKGVLYQRKVY